MNSDGALWRVRRAEWWLRGAAMASSVLRAAAGALVVVLVAAVLDAVVTMPVAARRIVPAAAFVSGAVILVRRLVWSGAFGQSIPSTALWIESRLPALRYMLVTAVDPSLAGRVPDLERSVSQVLFEPEIRRAARRAIAGPALAAVLAAVAVAALPDGTVARVIRPREGDALARVARGHGTGDPLGTIVVRVSPPAYARLSGESLDDPASVHALIGSTLTVEGRASAEPVAAQVGDSTKNASIERDRWRVSLTMPTTASAVRLRSAEHERLLMLEPLVDSAPVVTLALPVRDTIYRRPAGDVRLIAEASDDFGLAGGAFEYIVSSGGGENFTFRSGTFGATAFSGKSGTLTARLSLDTLALRPGDILHLRAVARDRNNVTGPGIGASETRALRIARSDEYDSVAVDGAPPPEPERNALSQRMLILLTEALQKKRRGLERPVLVGESRNIAVEQARLRRRVGEIVFTRLGESSIEEGDAFNKRLDRPVNPDSVLAAAERATTVQAGATLERTEDETPLVALNRPLLEAYNHMWNATTELEVAEPGRAIPWMQKALDALQVARAAERVYLRGRTRPLVVDIERVRLSGKDKGAPLPRSPRTAADPARLARLARFDAALAIACSAPAAAADSLLLVRLDLVDHDAAAARALESAANALRRPGDATAALAGARRALAGPPARQAPLTAWSAPW
ncbi:MAG TPA: hypothetical protein VHE78_17365 [Gemmatimonadaceae bacterium]|nr:hypothetical protein [Gemmatimonadaceae bacterium]